MRNVRKNIINILRLNIDQKLYEYLSLREILEKLLDGEPFNANEETSGTRNEVRLIQMRKRVGGVRMIVSSWQLQFIAVT